MQERGATFRQLSGKRTGFVRIHHVLIAAVFTSIILTLLIVANIGMDVLTSMRAYVGGEGLWSKAQKDAVHYLLRYGRTHDSGDYQRYLDAIRIPLSDHEARIGMIQPEVDRDKAGRAFVGGANHPDDVQGMINLFRRYHSNEHIARAIAAWNGADVYLEDLKRLGDRLHDEITGPHPAPAHVEELLAELDRLNEKFPPLENDFSRSLGDAARYARSVFFAVLLSGTALALILGLFVSWRLLQHAHQADQRYRHLFDTASDVIVIADQKTGLILDANAKLAELTGIPLEALVGTRQSDLFGREIPVIAGVSDLDTGDLVIRHVNGASIPVEVRVNVGRFGNSDVSYSIVRDMRERRRAEEQLKEAARMESVGRLAGGVAHDFNNLLTVINGYAQSLKRSVTGEALEKVDQIHAAAARAASLVRQLLAFSRKQPLESRTLNLNNLISNMQDMIRGILNEHISLYLELASDLGAVDADPHQVEQIILNLAANSRDAMPSGGRIVIRTWNEESEKGRFVGFSMADTGTGMDEATLSRVFEPFFTTKPHGKGTGLGLSTVYGTVRQSRGYIDVESQIGAGARFRILLPQSRRATADSSLAAEVEGTEGTETILLVEDDYAVRQVVQSGLEQEGYRVYTAMNGFDAIQKFGAYPNEIQLVISDLIMPEMGGIALGEHLKSVGAAVPVLYVTGYHSDLEKYPMHTLPLAAGFLLKPFTPRMLALAIRRVFAQKRASTSFVAQKSSNS